MCKIYEGEGEETGAPRRARRCIRTDALQMMQRAFHVTVQ
jgi:hypothetical protein